MTGRALTMLFAAAAGWMVRELTAANADYDRARRAEHEPFSRRELADVPFAPATEHAIAQAQTIVNCRPLAEAVADELLDRRRRRSGGDDR